MKKIVFLLLISLFSCTKEPYVEPVRTTVLFYTSNSSYELRTGPYVVRIVFPQLKPYCYDPPSETLKKPAMVPGTYQYTLYRAKLPSGVEYLKEGELTITEGCNIINLDKL